MWTPLDTASVKGHFITAEFSEVGAKISRHLGVLIRAAGSPEVTHHDPLRSLKGTSEFGVSKDCG